MKKNTTESKEIGDFSTEMLLKELERRQIEGAEADMTAMELELEAEGALRNSRTMGEYLRLHSERENCDSKACPKCGKKVPVKVRSRTRKVRTIAGEHRFARNYHYCATCRHGFYPLDHALGLAGEGEATTELEKRILDFGVNDTFEGAAQRWNVHYPSEISENLVRMVVDRVGRLAVDAEPEALQSAMVSQKKPAQLLVVEADGGMLPMRGKDQWREAKLGAVVRGEHYTPGSSKRAGYFSEGRYVAHVGGVDTFKSRLDAALIAEQADQATTVAWVGDGAPWIWNMADEICPSAIQVLDWPHAVGHVVDCGKAVLGDDDPTLALWVERAKSLLWEGQVATLLQELEACLFLCRGKRRTAIGDLIRYCTNNRARMNYAAFRIKGIPVGSGMIESAHKHVLQVRMKRAGQHWDPERADRMATLRAAYRTAGPARFHTAIRRAAGQARAA